MKICAKCKSKKKLSAFSKQTGTADGLRSACKSCNSIERADYYRKNQERLKAYAAEYRRKNAGKCRIAVKNSEEKYKTSKRQLPSRCKRGHELAGENLRYNSRGDRICRTCAIERNRSRRATSSPEVQAVSACPEKLDGHTRVGWLKLYGIKPKRTTVDYSKIDIPWC